MLTKSLAVDPLSWTCGNCGAVHSGVLSSQDPIVAMRVTSQRQVAPGVLSGRLAEWRIKKIQIHIEDQLRRPLTVESMAAYLGLSASYFCRAFKKSLRMAPHRYLMIQRVARARHLLRVTNMRMADIAVECGLADQAHLTKLFGQFYGMTPGVWRRHNANCMPGPAETQPSLHVQTDSLVSGAALNAAARKSVKARTFGDGRGPPGITACTSTGSSL
jgi:AraC-like DNA-binding protein